MADEPTSPGGSATPTPATPATGTPAPGSATPPAATPTLEEALRKIAELERSHTNATEEVERHRKKLTVYEKAEKDRETAAQAAKDAELSEVDQAKKQLATLQEQHEALAAELYEARVFQDVSRLAPKFNFLISADTLARMILLDDNAIEMEDGKPTNVEKLLDSLAKREPDLVRKQPTPPTEPGNQPTAPNAPNGLNRPAPPPTLPALNTGRASIPAPGQGQGQPFKRPSLSEAHALERQRQRGA